MRHSFLWSLLPDNKKELTGHKLIEAMPPPAQVILPLSMYAGFACFPVVSVGCHVSMGQIIAEPRDELSALMHSSVSGTVTEIKPCPHPNGGLSESIVIQNDFADTVAPQITYSYDANLLSEDELIDIIKYAGIAGLDETAYPAHHKISSASGKADTLIINAAQSEPYITSDDALAKKHPEKVIGGLRILMRLLHVTKTYIAVPRDRHDTVSALSGLLGSKHGIEISRLNTQFPHGAEKPLIQSVTGRQVPPGGSALDVKCVVFDITAAAAIYDGVYTGMPLIERVVTVAGSAVAEPKNLLCRIGTPLGELINAAGGFSAEPYKILAGGPMTGVAQAELSAPVIKTTAGITALSLADKPKEKAQKCIRCGRCVSACPMKLMPAYIHMYLQNGSFSALSRLNAQDCIECGRCAYVCPGRISLMDSVKAAKELIEPAAKSREALTV